MMMFKRYIKVSLEKKADEYGIIMPHDRPNPYYEKIVERQTKRLFVGSLILIGTTVVLVTVGQITVNALNPASRK
jgi:hypothetical protein